jgi:hypothetical protein
MEWDGGIVRPNHPHGEKDHVEQTRTQPGDNHPDSRFSWGRTTLTGFRFVTIHRHHLPGALPPPGSGPSVGSLHRGRLSFEAPEVTETPDHLAHDPRQPVPSLTVSERPGPRIPGGSKTACWSTPPTCWSRIWLWSGRSQTGVRRRPPGVLSRLPRATGAVDTRQDVPVPGGPVVDGAGLQARTPALPPRHQRRLSAL